MEKLTNLQLVQKICQDHTGVAAESITAESRFEENPKADSLDMVEMVMALEDELDVEIPDETAGSWKTVGDVVAWLDNLKVVP